VIPLSQIPLLTLTLLAMFISFIFLGSSIPRKKALKTVRTPHRQRPILENSQSISLLSVILWLLVLTLMPALIAITFNINGFVVFAIWCLVQLSATAILGNRNPDGRSET